MPQSGQTSQQALGRIIDNDPSKPRLYNWYAVMGIHDTDESTPNKEFAPEGWHVSSDTEWTTLVEYLIANGYNYDGTTTENKLAKAMASTTGWNTSTGTGEIGNDQSLNNSSGFNAFPEGLRYSDGSFNSEVAMQSFGLLTEDDSNSAWIPARTTNVFTTVAKWGHLRQAHGFSVRFVRD